MARNISRRRKDKTPQEPTINITPLIDVVFVILIAFIVIAPLLELDRVELAHGGSPSHLPVRFEDAGPIQIHVNATNNIFFGKIPITLDELPSLLLASKKQHPQARAQLFHDKRAQFGTYQEIKNALEKAGFQELDIVLVPS